MKLQEKAKNNIAITCFIIGILLLAMGTALDLEYSGRINSYCIDGIIDCMKYILMPIGFRYHIAFEIISGSMGLSFTALSLLLSMGVNLSNRSEIKIFGVPRWELDASKAHKIYNSFHKLIYAFPFIMLICINLRLCVVGYLVLMYNLLFLIVDYIIISRSYRWEKNIVFTVNKLIMVFKESDNKSNSDYAEYQLWLEEIRIGIEKSEGWEKAERLFEYFIQQASEFENKKCYISFYYFFDIIFCKGSQNNLSNSALRCIKKYLCKLYEENCQIWNEIIFCALIKVIFKYWNESQIDTFLKWFLDFAGRSNGGSADKIKYIDAKQMIQINIVMVMIEEWKTHQKVYNGLLNVKLKALWFLGNLSGTKDNLYSPLFENVHNTEVYLRYEEDSTIEAFKNLQEDYKINRGISFIGSTVKK